MGIFFAFRPASSEVSRGVGLRSKNAVSGIEFIKSALDGKAVASSTGKTVTLGSGARDIDADGSDWFDRNCNKEIDLEPDSDGKYN